MGSTIAPFVAIVIIAIIAFTWKALTQAGWKSWAQEAPPLGEVDISNGIAPNIAPERKNRSRWLRGYKWLLDHI
jgi:hypothetical protein